MAVQAFSSGPTAFHPGSGSAWADSLTERVRRPTASDPNMSTIVATPGTVDRITVDALNLRPRNEIGD